MKTEKISFWNDLKGTNFGISVIHRKQKGTWVTLTLAKTSETITGDMENKWLNSESSVMIPLGPVSFLISKWPMETNMKKCMEIR